VRETLALSGGADQLADPVIEVGRWGIQRLDHVDAASSGVLAAHGGYLVAEAGQDLAIGVAEVDGKEALLLSEWVSGMRKVTRIGV
jgi:hypothetical protein